jgi:hypothetical protein
VASTLDFGEKQNMKRTLKLVSSFVAMSLTILLVLSSSAAFGQTTSGALSGTVKDATGAVIPNATVVAVSEGTKVAYNGTSGASGEVLISNLPLGLYDVTASATGFQSFTLTGVAIDLNKSSAESFTLTAGATSSTVEVSAEAGISLDTQTVNLTQTFQPAELSVLPSATVGLGVLNLSLLSPNVASNGGIGQGRGPSVAGLRPTNNNFMIEGIDNNNKGITGPLVYVPNDNVGEFSLIVGQFSPEFGHSSGGQFNTGIKSGTNSFHGVGYEYFQNRNLNAINIPSGPPQPKARYDFNRYGGSIGGPIKRNKLFFFGGYERQTTGQNVQGFICTPTAAGIAAIQAVPGLSATNLAQYVKYTPVSPAQVTDANDAACFNEVSGPQFLYVYPGTALSPAPSYGAVPVYGSGTPTTVPLGNFLISAPAFTNFKALTTSGDYTISQTDNLRVRYIYNANGTEDTVAEIPNFYTTEPSKYHLVAISEYHNFTPNLTNEVRVGFNRYANQDPDGGFTFPGLSAFPNLVFADLDQLQYGPDGNAPQSTVQNLYEFTDDIHYTKGTHTLTFGFDGRKSISPQTFTQRVRGDYEYNYLTEYLHDLGATCTVCSAGISGQRSTGNFIYYGDQTSLYGYGNDTWRVTPQLTLNYGLRYEFTSVPTGERAQSLNLSASVPGLVNFSAPQPQYKNFAPRIGVSYAPDDKTVIRAGFGLAYDVLYDNLGLLSFPPQYSSTTNIGDAGLPASDNAGAPGFLANGGLPTGTGSLATFNSTPTSACPASGTVAVALCKQRKATSAYLPNQVVPYSEVWSLGVERTVGANTTFTIQYVGSRGIHLPTQDQINVQPRTTAANQLTTYFGANATGIGSTISTTSNANTLAGVLTNSNIIAAWSAQDFTGKITSYQPYSESNYNGGSISVVRRMKEGLAINGAYTYSKTMDDATASTFSTILTPRRQQNSQCIACDYSRSALDRTNRISLAFVYDLPYFKHSNFLLKNIAGNWEIAPIYIYESPEYATVLSGTDANENGDSIDRAIINPNGVRGTASKVNPVYSSNLAAACGTATTCNGNLVGYVAVNPNAYYIQAGAGTLPNDERNTLPGRPIDNIDVSAVKRISFTERYSFEFHAEAFNVLNHPQYVAGTLDNVSLTQTNADSNAFLLASSPTTIFNHPEKLFASNARTMQLSAKFIF